MGRTLAALLIWFGLSVASEVEEQHEIPIGSSHPSLVRIQPCLVGLLALCAAMCLIQRCVRMVGVDALDSPWTTTVLLLMCIWCLGFVVIAIFILPHLFSTHPDMCNWLSDSDCDVYANAALESESDPATVEGWLTMAYWGTLNVSSNVLQFCFTAGVVAAFIGFIGALFARDLGPVVFGLGIFGGCTLLGCIAFLALLLTTMLASLSSSVVMACLMLLALMPVAFVLTSMIGFVQTSLDSRATSPSSTVLSVAGRALWICLGIIGKATVFVCDLCMVSTSFYTWFVFKPCPDVVGCEASDSVAALLRAAFPWVPQALSNLAGHFQQVFSTFYKLGDVLHGVFDIRCAGFAGLVLAACLLGGVVGVAALQIFRFRGRLAKLQCLIAQAPPVRAAAAKIAFVVLHFAGMKMLEFMITLGNGTYVLMFFGAEARCYAGPDRFMWYLNFPFVWTSGSLALFIIFGIVFTPDGKATLSGSSLECLRAAAWTCAGLWHEKETWGSNILLLGIREQSADLEYAKNLVHISAEFYGIALMAFPLGTVAGKFVQYVNSGSILTIGPCCLPVDSIAEHMRKCFAVLEFAFIVAIVLSPRDIGVTLLKVALSLLVSDSVLESYIFIQKHFRHWPSPSSQRSAEPVPDVVGSSV